jgi:hypothetical protein
MITCEPINMAVPFDLSHRPYGIRLLVCASKQRYVTPYLVAQIYASLGETDEALRWLEVAYRQRTAWMVLLKVDPRFDGVRCDPRFQDLLRRINFPEAA